MNPTNESFHSGSYAVPIEVFMPAATARPCAAALVLHGSVGLPPQFRNDIVSFAAALSARGIAAVLPHYIEATGTRLDAAGPQPKGAVLLVEMQPVWRRIAADTLAWMAADPRFDPARLGLLGFSLGANLALAVAMDPPSKVRARCVVDFFGPIVGLDPHWARLPPVLILHGTKDDTVPPAESARLVALLAAAGKAKGSDYQFKAYDGEGHGFKGAHLAQSRDEAVQFIEKAVRA